MKLEWENVNGLFARIDGFLGNIYIEINFK